jgi:hypothetical protein
MQKLTIAILVLFCLSFAMAKKHALVGKWVGPIEDHNKEKLYTFHFFEVPFHSHRRLMLHVIPPDTTGPEVWAHVTKTDFEVRPHDIDLRAINGTHEGKFSFGLFELHSAHSHKAMRLALNPFGDHQRPEGFHKGTKATVWDLKKHA